MSLNTFQKKEKLCGEIRIGKLFSEGDAFIAYPLRIVYQASNEHLDSPVKVMISVPKKRIKLAVRRNRIKRMIKEAYRLNKTDFLNTVESKGLHLNLAITYVSEKELDFSLLQEKIRYSLPKILNTLNKNKEQK